MQRVSGFALLGVYYIASCSQIFASRCSLYIHDTSLTKVIVVTSLTATAGANTLYNVVVITYKVLRGATPRYLEPLTRIAGVRSTYTPVCCYQPSRCMPSYRPSNYLSLTDSRAFPVVAAKLSGKHCVTMSSFQHHPSTRSRVTGQSIPCSDYPRIHIRLLLYPIQN